MSNNIQRAPYTPHTPSNINQYLNKKLSSNSNIATDIINTNTKQTKDIKVQKERSYPKTQIKKNQDKDPLSTYSTHKQTSKFSNSSIAAEELAPNRKSFHNKKLKRHENTKSDLSQTQTIQSKKV